MTKPIHLFQPTYHIPETLALIEQCLESGWTGAGQLVRDFEAAWKDYTGLPNAHFVSSATAGLHLAAQLLKDANGWEIGDQIITTPLTFVSTNHAILYTGLVPMFADVDEYLTLSPESVLERIGPKTRAVMFVGLGGNVGRYPEIAEICREKGLKIILDAAHMAGSRWLGRHVGYDADVVVYSFHAVKNLPMADGGMVCFRDATLDQKARVMSWMGINKDTFTRSQGGNGYSWEYDVENIGWKYNGNNIMAAMGLAGLPHLDAENHRRRDIAKLYSCHLPPHIQSVPTRPGCESSQHLYQILIPDRNETILKLQQQQIYPGVHYRINTDYRMYRYAHCPNAQVASDKVLSLPMHLRLTNDDVMEVCQAIGEICESTTKAA